jgi:hypothetical protein
LVDISLVEKVCVNNEKNFINNWIQQGELLV